MYLVKLLLALLCVLSVCSIVASQSCPSTGIACIPGDCCAKFQQCSGTTFWPVQDTAPGTVCQAGAIVHASSCTTPCAAQQTSTVRPPNAEATTKPVPTAAPATSAPATASPATVAPATLAPATPAPKAATPSSEAATAAPATASPTASPTKVPTAAPVATAAPTKAPTAAPVATVAPGSSGSSKFGQLLLAYYSGIALDTLGEGGVNAIAMAFFDPTPLGTGTCDFTDRNTRCVAPASGSGSSKNLAWALNVIAQATPQLSLNTAPKRGGKPTIYFSFGGYSQGGDCWDELLGSKSTAETFGRNAAKLVTSVYEQIGQTAYIGFDLDVEETHTALPYLADFLAAFRAIAPYDTFPLQICTLSGLTDPSNADFFKVGIMQQHGPAQKEINYLNMMVANVDLSCADMRKYWMHSALDFLPAANKIFGLWGAQLPTWTLHDPGCSGANGLFQEMQRTKAGFGIWQWWAGSADGVTSVLNQARAQ